jgi:hypothetical protein
MAPSTQKQWSVQNKENDFNGLKYDDAPVPRSARTKSSSSSTLRL